MYSTTWVNQFEIKNTCIEFVINVSLQGNVKRKLNLKWKKFTEITVLIFYEISDKAPRFSLAISETYS